MCLQSVFAAIEAYGSNDQIEILVSNNASNDGTEEFIKEIPNRRPNIRIITWTNNYNIGFIRNIKLVMSRATGEYIFFITDDDLLLPNALVVVTKALEEKSYSFLKTANITYLMKEKQCFYQGLKNAISDDLDPRRFIEIMKYTHILSGCIVKNSDELHLTLGRTQNIYPSIEMCALSAGNCKFINEPVVIHLWENEVFWDADVDMSTEKAKLNNLHRDFQLALLHIPAHYLGTQDISYLYNHLTQAHGYIEPKLLEKFGPHSHRSRFTQTIRSGARHLREKLRI
jgi:glycosyltransferase involved in cell wall biosynthesis